MFSNCELFLWLRRLCVHDSDRWGCSKAFFLASAGCQRLVASRPPKKIAALCESCGVRTAFQEGGDNDPVNQLAAYHVDMSISSLGVQEENHFPELVHEMMPGPDIIRGGYL